MRKLVFAIALVGCWLVGGASATHAQTFQFKAGNPVWVPTPNGSVSTTVEWSMLAGQTVTKVEIHVYKVTFPGGIRTESPVGGGNDSAPPAIPAVGNYGLGVAIDVAATYCVRSKLTYTSGGNTFTLNLVSADQAL